MKFLRILFSYNNESLLLLLAEVTGTKSQTSKALTSGIKDSSPLPMNKTRALNLFGSAQ